MTIYQVMQELAVKIICEGSGSGFLYQFPSNEYTYVITAYHCIERSYNEELKTVDTTKIKIIRYYATESDPQLEIIRAYIDIEEDIAVLLVKRIADIPNIYTRSPIPNEPIFIYGYPERLENENVKDGDPRHLLRGDTNFIDIDKARFDVTSKGFHMTFSTGIPQNIASFSGSAVFYSDIGQNELYFVGVFLGLITPDGAYQALRCIDYTAVNKLLQKFTMCQLTPGCLVNFKEYIEEAFREHDMSIESVLQVRAPNSTNLTPLQLLDKYKDRLFFITNKRNNIIDRNLWTGWITLLTYLHIELGDPIDLSNLSSVFSRKCLDRTSKIKFYFADSNIRIEEAVRILCTEGRDILEVNDCVIINSNGRFSSTIMNSERIKRVVRSITSPDVRLKYGIRIDRDDFTKNISCLYLDAFKLRFSDIEYNDDLFFIEGEMKQRIAGVFNDAI